MPKTIYLLIRLDRRYDNPLIDLLNFNLSYHGPFKLQEKFKYHSIIENLIPLFHDLELDNSLYFLLMILYRSRSNPFFRLLFSFKMTTIY